jgi:hypothetical protein
MNGVARWDLTARGSRQYSNAMTSTTTHFLSIRRRRRRAASQTD